MTCSGLKIPLLPLSGMPSSSIDKVHTDRKNLGLTSQFVSEPPMNRAS
ncbi:hypothetical protein LMG28727_07750 [Paraburkholderia kirstenboschensis]|nr:hypothetical protein LMG28727_07750 [Paraburkholderia kirstenboschensis]